MHPGSSGPPGGVLAQRERIALWTLLAIGAVLRAYGLGSAGLWIDEYGTWWAIAGETWADCWDRVLAIHGQSPLYYAIVRASTAAFGVGRVGLRFPSLLAGLGLLALAYPLALRLFRDRRVALVCVAAFAVNSRLIFHSQEARPYALALLFVAGAFHFHVAAVERGRARDHLAATAANLLAFYTHYLFGIAMLAQAIHLLVRRPTAWSRWIAQALALGALCAPGLIQLRALFARRQTLDWTPDAGPWDGLELAANLADPLVTGAVAAAFGLALLLRRCERPAQGADVALPLLWFGVPVFVVVVAAPAVGIHLNHERYLLAAAPAVPLLTGLCLGLVSRWRAPLVGAFLALTIGLRIVPQVQRSGGPFWWFYQQGWEPAVAKIVDEYRDGDVILYRTGFVELDAIVLGTASPMSREFAEWPLLAHLPADREYRRVAIAYSTGPAVMQPLANRLRRLRAKRVWLLGLDPVDMTGTSFEYLETMVRRGRALQIVAGQHYGVVALYLSR